MPQPTLTHGLTPRPHHSLRHSHGHGAPQASAPSLSPSLEDYPSPQSRRRPSHLARSSIDVVASSVWSNHRWLFCELVELSIDLVELVELWVDLERLNY
jgi:hypothetical protein